MFKAAPCRGFLPYWLNIRRAGETMPRRSALDPTAIPRLLPSLILYDVGDTPESVTYRLVGTEITRRWGYDPTGRRYADVVGGEEGYRAACAVLRVVQESLGLRMVRRHRRPSGRGEDVEICCLPIWDDRRAAAQAVSVSAPLACDQRLMDCEADPVSRRTMMECRYFLPDDENADVCSLA